MVPGAPKGSEKMIRKVLLTSPGTPPTGYELLLNESLAQDFIEGRSGGGGGI